LNSAQDSSVRNRLVGPEGRIDFRLQCAFARERACASSESTGSSVVHTTRTSNFFEDAVRAVSEFGSQHRRSQRCHTEPAVLLGPAAREMPK
jgi:hypothetical protein